MCFFHVDKDCKKVCDKFTNKSHPEGIKHDISVIQLSKLRVEFDKVNSMFYFKWLSLEDEQTNKFIS